MEYLAIYNAQNEPLQQTLPRRQVHELGHWHRTAQIFVHHPEQGYLCHRRSRHKDLFPSLWDISIGGHLSPGESYETCAARELSEELGLAVTPADVRFVAVMSIDGQDEQAQLLDREHAGIFLYQTQREAQSFEFQREEIEVVQYVPVRQLVGELQAPEPVRAFIPLQTQFLEMLQLVQELVLKP
ncbi:NUDIX hydrolase [Rufibacter quisquiliarum]|uniref:Isopentenyldiphosphate isomerase n=1 Tax=Rufibacter quisquiliarum TaxID=1549639 RepID=A0A839G7V7_9BACT|nr:NUDIX domain-containing protein [Rufibacter quisquiliarum]MBA9075514.1 isopentenyldiphosphate isomerase [Rufibacter quisquiliarum]